MANNIVATWGFKRKLPEPFEDYTGTTVIPIWTPLRKQQPFSATTFTGEPAMHQVSRPVVLRLTFRQTAYCR